MVGKFKGIKRVAGMSYLNKAITLSFLAICQVKNPFPILSIKKYRLSITYNLKDDKNLEYTRFSAVNKLTSENFLF